MRSAGKAGSLPRRVRLALCPPGRGHHRALCPSSASLLALWLLTDLTWESWWAGLFSCPQQSAAAEENQEKDLLVLPAVTVFSISVVKLFCSVFINPFCSSGIYASFCNFWWELCYIPSTLVMDCRNHWAEFSCRVAMYVSVSVLLSLWRL